MASQVFNLSAESKDIADWQQIQLDIYDAAYRSGNGHMAFELSGFAPTSETFYTIAIAWVDCDDSAENAVIGVSKYQTISVESSGFSTGNGEYVLDFFDPADRFIETYGLGACIDMRSNPVSVPKRKAFIGLINNFGGGLPLTIIATPTKIV